MLLRRKTTSVTNKEVENGIKMEFALLHYLLDYPFSGVGDLISFYGNSQIVQQTVWWFLTVDTGSCLNNGVY